MTQIREIKFTPINNLTDKSDTLMHLLAMSYHWSGVLSVNWNDTNEHKKARQDAHNAWKELEAHVEKLEAFAAKVMTEEEKKEMRTYVFPDGSDSSINPNKETA